MVSLSDLPSPPRSPSLFTPLSLSLWCLGLGLDFSNHSEILQQCCRDACQFAGICNDYNSQSRGIGTCGKTSVRLVNRGTELVPTKTKHEDCSKCWCTECMNYFKMLFSWETTMAESYWMENGICYSGNPLLLCIICTFVHYHNAFVNDWKINTHTE